jgi:hypothetical protein
MAVARCQTCGRPERTKRFDYVFVAEPVDYPDPKIRCGKKSCQNPARIWLYVIDAMMYKNRKQRNFQLPFHPAKTVTLKDGGYFVPDKRYIDPLPQSERMKGMNDYLTRRIAELKRQYPDSTGYIESKLQDYLQEDGPPADDEFYFLLKRPLEIDHPQPLKQKRSRREQRAPGRTSRR